jgi:hypothetical protein
LPPECPKKRSEKSGGLADNQAGILRALVEISQPEFEQLLQFIRDLTVRVHRLESLLHVQAPQAAAAVGPAKPAVIQSSPVPQSVTPPTPSVFATVSAASAKSDLEARIGSQWLNRIGIAAVLIGLFVFP